MLLCCSNKELMMRKQYRKQQCGQVLTEYALMLCIFVVLALSLFFVLSAMLDHGWRVLSYLAWEPFID